MKEPVFLTIEEVLKTHQRSIELYGGSYGVRDFESLLSAINMPSSTFDGYYLHSDLYSMAAAYLFHLVKNTLLLMEINVLVCVLHCYFCI